MNDKIVERDINLVNLCADLGILNSILGSLRSVCSSAPVPFPRHGGVPQIPQMDNGPMGVWM
jgi:hypothetical protein